MPLVQINSCSKYFPSSFDLKFFTKNAYSYSLRANQNTKFHKQIEQKDFQDSQSDILIL